MCSWQLPPALHTDAPTLYTLTSSSSKSQSAAHATAPEQRTAAAHMGGGTTLCASSVSSTRRPSTTAAVPRRETSGSQAKPSCGAAAQVGMGARCGQGGAGQVKLGG